MQLGIVGLPTSGKTTVFNALTGAGRPTSIAPSGRMEMHIAVIDVPDPRLDVLGDMFAPRKKVYAQVKCIDIAGLGKGMGKTGIEGPLRTELSQLDGLIHVVRAFGDPNIPHPEGSVNPARDLETLDTEFILADLTVVENRLERLEDDRRKGKGDKQTIARESAFFERLRSHLEAGKPLRDLGLTPDEAKDLRGYGFLTLKPVLIALNLGDDDEPPQIEYDHAASAVLPIRGKLEAEISQLEPDEAEMFMREYGIESPGRDRILREAYRLLNLHTFFTIGDKEVRAWALPVGGTALDAAGTIHTDMARGFIRAEVIGYDELLSAGGLPQAKSAGLVRLEGRDYIVQDGDVIYIRFNV